MTRSPSMFRCDLPKRCVGFAPAADGQFTRFSVQKLCHRRTVYTSALSLSVCGCVRVSKRANMIIINRALLQSANCYVTRYAPCDITSTPLFVTAAMHASNEVTYCSFRIFRVVWNDLLLGNNNNNNKDNKPSLSTL